MEGDVDAEEGGEEGEGRREEAKVREGQVCQFLQFHSYTYILPDFQVVRSRATSRTTAAVATRRAETAPGEEEGKSRRMYS